MNIALLQATLSFADVNQLIKEFPQFLFLSFPESSFQSITDEHWSMVEVLLSHHLSPVELSLATQLRWVHCPSQSLKRLCLEEIEKQGNILVTNTREENLVQIGEYVLGVVLAFAKNLFHWQEANQVPPLLWDSKWRNSMWSLQDKLFLQIGLGKPGTEIAHNFSQLGVKVWGVDTEASFHPYCHKTFSFEDLDVLLPLVDVVSICLPRDKGYIKWFGKEQLTQMKEDSILVVVGSSKLVDEAALNEVGRTKKLRGIAIDGEYQLPVSSHLPIWTLPNLLVTPEVAPRPKLGPEQTLKLFRYNLRQYVHGNYSDMKNLIDPTLAVSSGTEEWY